MDTYEKLRDAVYKDKYKWYDDDDICDIGYPMHVWNVLELMKHIIVTDYLKEFEPYGLPDRCVFVAGVAEYDLIRQLLDRLCTDGIHYNLETSNGKYCGY